MIKHCKFFVYNSERMQTGKCLSNSKFFICPFFFLMNQKTLGLLFNNFKLRGSQGLQKKPQM